MKGGQFLAVEGIVEAEHGRAVGNLAEAFTRLSPDPLSRGIRGEDLGVFLFECLKLAHQRVVVGVADLGLILHVVLILVMPDLIAQALGSPPGVGAHEHSIIMIEGTGRKLISRIQRLQGNVTYRKIALLYNPFAGGLQGAKSSRLLDAEKALGKYGAEVEIMATDAPRSAGRIAACAIANGADLIVVAGGDGTVNEATEGVAGTDVPLAVLPAGTANVLASEMRVTTNLGKAAAELLSYPAERISIGRIQSRDEVPRSFLLMAGAGLDAHIVYSLDYSLKRKLGKVAYWLAGFRQFGRTFAEFSVRIDGQEYQATFALISKVRNYGGDLEIAREVSLLDNEFEVVLFHGRESWRYVKYLAGVALQRLKGMKGVTVLRTREVELANAGDDRVYLQVDGEFAGHLPARVEIVPSSLSLLIPPPYVSAHPRRTDAALAGSSLRDSL